MKIALLVFVGVIVVAVVAYFLLFPRNTFISFSRPGGGTVTFSRTGVSLEAAPDHYAANGFDHIEPYVSRLLVPTNRFKFLQIFTPDGNRGFGFSARDGVVQAGLTIEWATGGPERGGYPRILQFSRHCTITRLPRWQWRRA